MGGRLVYADECHIQDRPDLATCWHKRGVRPRIPLGAGHHRLSLFGAVDYGSGEFVTAQEATANGPAFLRFLDTLVTRWPTRAITLVLDNVSYHKSPAVRVWFVAHPQVTPLYPPKYSPELNLIERVWQFLKSKLANHRLGRSFAEVQARVETLCAHLAITFAEPELPHLRLRQDF